MRLRNVRRRQARRYMARETRAGRMTPGFAIRWGVECQWRGHPASWHRRFPFRIDGETM